MTVGLDLESSDVSVAFVNWLLETGLWDGRPVTWQSAAQFQKEVGEKIVSILSANDETAEKWAAYLAWMGTRESERPLVARDILALKISSGEVVIQARHKHKHKKKEGFFEKHKKAILIGLGVVVVVAAVATAVILSGGTATGNAVALGAVALDQLLDYEPEKPISSPRPPTSLALASEESRSLFDHPLPLQEIPARPTPEVNFLPSIPSAPPPPAASPYKLAYLENGVQLGDQYLTYAEILQEVNNELRFIPMSSPKSSFDFPSKPEPLPRGIHIPQRIEELRPNPLSGYAKEPDPIPHAKSPSSKIREFFETATRGLIEPELLDPNYPLIKHPEFSERFETGGVKHPKCQIGWINGMYNQKSEAIEGGAYLNKLAGGLNIECVYNRTHGPLVDIAEIFALNYAGNSPNTGELLGENWTNFHNQNLDNLNLKYLQFCHSQAAIHVRNELEKSPKEIRDRVIVVAIAPGAIVTNDLCFRAFNYASKRDLVPYGELIYSTAIDGIHPNHGESIKKAFEKHAELIVLEPHPDAPLFDHSWQSPTFEQTIGDILKLYIDCNGEYK